MAQYYELIKVKDRVNIQQSDPTWDKLLNDMGQAADKEVDARIFEVASKNRYLFQLPVLPLAAPVDQSIMDSSTNRVVAKWWRRQQNWEGAKAAQQESEDAITNWISRQNVNKVRYGIVLGGPDSQFTG